MSELLLDRPGLELRPDLPGRSAALRHQRHDARTPLVIRRGTCRFAAHRRRGRSPAPLAPHQLRHAHAVEGVPLIVIQPQLGHSNLGITSDSGGIIETVHARRAPMIPVSASLRL